jgi:hypothetical protein
MIRPRMPEPNIAPAARRRERWIVLAIVLGIVAARSAVFLVWPESYFDADQAIVGLMAKHLAELRAFPMFLYGQTYMLGVEAWLAAPLFVVAGASATALKLPLLVMNGTIAVLLVRTFEREMGLRPVAAAIASLPFILPAPGLAAVFMDSSGGSLEPYLYVLLLWVTRHRPLWCGVVFGIGFLNREFTVYGLAALATIEALDRTLFTRAGGARFARVLAVAAMVWLAVQGLKTVSSASGPGTTIAQTFTASNNIMELAARTCVSPATALSGAGRLFSIHWPAVLGTAAVPLTAFSIESRVSQGFGGASWLPAVFVILSIAGIAIAPRSARDRPRPPRFAQYLVLVGFFSIAGYLFGRCGQVAFLAMRYELLSVLGIVGLAAWFLSAHPPRAMQGAWLTTLALWIAVVAVPHVRLVAEYATDPPVPAKRELIQMLRGRGIRYGVADYWIAYYIDFMTHERMVFASTGPKRILLYDAIVAEHAAEAVRLSRQRCDGGVLLMAGVYQCP